MRHARSDYNRIQDPENKIPADEPVFLIRGQDRAAVATIKAYAIFAEREGADPDFVSMVRLWADTMAHWQEAKGLRVKVPDLPTPDSRFPTPTMTCSECATGNLWTVDGKRICDQCGVTSDQ